MDNGAMDIHIHGESQRQDGPDKLVWPRSWQASASAVGGRTKDNERKPSAKLRSTEFEKQLMAGTRVGGNDELGTTIVVQINRNMV